MLTQKRLKELLHYEPDTGVFTWLVSRGSAAKGSAAVSKHNQGYMSISVDGVAHLTHRLAVLYMTGEFPLEQVDHINHIRVDNRWCNLRNVTVTGNRRNQSISITNTSGHVGVYWHKGAGRWMAQIMVNKKAKYLGLHVTITGAIAARKVAEVEYGFHANHGQ